MAAFSGNRRGAFQLSLSFIIGVVFAIVLLSLAVIWIQDLMGGMGQIGTDLTDQAHTKLVETFEQTTEDFAIWPPQYTVKAGEFLKMAAGIKNDAVDGMSHNFVINIMVEEVPAGVNKNYVKNWITFIKPAKTIAIGRSNEIPITFQVPNNAIKGIYLFRITSCYDRTHSGATVTPNSDNCMPTSDNMWGPSAQDFVMTVE